MRWIQPILQNILLERFAEVAIKSDCKNEWHVCLGHSSVQVLHKLQEFMSETGHVLEFSRQDHLREHVPRNDITNLEEVGSCKMNVWLKQEEWPLSQQDSGYWGCCGQGSEKTKKCKEVRPSHLVADGEWDKLPLKTRGELITSKQPMFKCSNILQPSALITRKETYFENDSDNHRMLVK